MTFEASGSVIIESIEDSATRETNIGSVTLPVAADGVGGGGGRGGRQRRRARRVARATQDQTDELSTQTQLLDEILEVLEDSEGVAGGGGGGGGGGGLGSGGLGLGLGLGSLLSRGGGIAGSSAAGVALRGAGAAGLGALLGIEATRRFQDTGGEQATRDIAEQIPAGDRLQQLALGADAAIGATTNPLGPSILESGATIGDIADEGLLDGLTGGPRQAAIQRGRTNTFDAFNDSVEDFSDNVQSFGRFVTGRSDDPDATVSASEETFKQAVTNTGLEDQIITQQKKKKKSRQLTGGNDADTSTTINVEASVDASGDQMPTQADLNQALEQAKAEAIREMRRSAKSEAVSKGLNSRFQRTF